jgi:D-alanine transaminase
VPHRLASVHIGDRGCQFADSVYEVLATVGGHLVDETPHLVRLARSVNPVLVVTSRWKRRVDRQLADGGIAVIAIPDIRWQRCDIKSVALLPNVGEQRAKEAGDYEAWQAAREGGVSEGTSANAWIVSADRTVVTRQADSAILNGVTRLTVFEIIGRGGYSLVERPLALDEARAASGGVLTSTNVDLLPVVRIDGDPVGSRVPGPLSRRLRGCCLAHAAAAEGPP